MLALFFTACNPTTLKDNPAASVSPAVPAPASAVVSIPLSLPNTQQDTDLDDLTIKDASIEGKYTLKRGLFGTQEIIEGYLVVEEIDPNNYGYYYVTVTEGFSPETHTGIFYNKGGKYVQKVIEDSSEAEIRQGKKKSKMSIIDNISIKKKDELLILNIDSNKKEKLFWLRDDDEEVKKSEKLIKTLENAKSEYRVYYKDKCVDCKEFCGSAEYTKVDDKN